MAHPGFLCPITANNYGIEFLNFVISDYEVSNGEGSKGIDKQLV